MSLLVESDMLPMCLSVLAGVGMAYAITRIPKQQGPPMGLRYESYREIKREKREIREEELKLHDWKHDRVWISVKGDVFDVSSHPTGIELYGRTGTYRNFAGRVADVGLALSSYEIEDFVGKTMNDPSIGYWERDRLEDWYATFRSKYDIVGQLVVEENNKKLNTTTDAESNGDKR